MGVKLILWAISGMVLRLLWGGFAYAEDLILSLPLCCYHELSELGAAFDMAIYVYRAFLCG